MKPRIADRWGQRMSKVGGLKGEGPDQAILSSVLRAFEQWPGLKIAPELLSAARARAQAVIRSGSPVEEHAGIARLVFAAVLLGGLVGQLSADPAEFAELVPRLETDAGIPVLALGVVTVQTIALARHPFKQGLRLQLAVLTAFTGARATSVWTFPAGGEPECVASAGAPGSGLAPARRLAVQLARGAPEYTSDADAIAIRLGLGAGEMTALIASGLSEAHSDVRLLLEGSSQAVTTALEHERLVARSGIAGEDAIARAERQLSRLRFDLHDGPQQDAILLAEDMQLLHSQLFSALGEHPDRHRLLGRLEDLEARLVALDGDLRRISASLQSPFLQAGTLADTVAELIDGFRERTGIEVELTAEGDTAELTDSQHITLLGLIREALNNVREHSEASTVTIRLAASNGSVEAIVTDDGRGFDPELTLVSAAREGHLGLVGMHERVRMLGGTTTIESRPGGPTTISASLPAAPADVPRRSA